MKDLLINRVQNGFILIEPSDVRGIPEKNWVYNNPEDLAKAVHDWAEANLNENEEIQ